MSQDQERLEKSGGSGIRVCGKLVARSESDAVGCRQWSLVGCAVSNESSCSIAICESSTSEAGGQAGVRLASFRLELGCGTSASARLRISYYYYSTMAYSCDI